MFVSEEFRTFLGDFVVGRGKYRATRIKGLSEKKTYYFLNLISCPVIDFPASTFEVTYRDTKKSEQIPLVSTDDFHLRFMARPFPAD